VESGAFWVLRPSFGEGASLGEIAVAKADPLCGKRWVNELYLAAVVPRLVRQSLGVEPQKPVLDYDTPLKDAGIEKPVQLRLKAAVQLWIIHPDTHRPASSPLSA
jgi:hypothetical protein